jgi:two-component system CheB/CheR fusion protein
MTEHHVAGAPPSKSDESGPDETTAKKGEAESPPRAKRKTTRTSAAKSKAKAKGTGKKGTAKKGASNAESEVVAASRGPGADDPVPPRETAAAVVAEAHPGNDADGEAASVKDSVAVADDAPTLVVGVAASAGGLEALRAFVAGLDSTAGMAYIVAQHMSPHHRSMMVELLARETRLPVSEAQHGMSLARGHIYVGPPNSDVFVKDGRLGLREPLSQIGPKPSADYLFASLAEAYGVNAIGIVMSGTGTDGTHGVRAINAAGGICMAQTPGSAKYDSMPAAAIRAGVDFVLTPEELGIQLLAITRQPRAQLADRLKGADRQSSPLERLLGHIYEEKKLDFSDYKESTIVRQIERRMAVHRVADIEAYVKLAESNPAEIEALATSFMVCVTSFFRDPEVFDTLRGAIKSLINVKRKTHEQDLRIWVPGCATGEEAYSIAILIAEELRNDFSRWGVQIFATDINRVALEIGRKGQYPESSIENVEGQLLDRWFQAQDREFVLDRKLRETVLFAQHDLVQDPPFVRLDLVSCRNLLIYLRPTLQDKVLGVFSYALNPSGYLLLGKSETLGHGQDDQYDVEDRKSRLYRKRFDAKATFPVLGRNLGRRQLRPETSAGSKREGPLSAITEPASEGSARSTLFDAYVPPTARITAEGRVLEVWGTVDPFLKWRPGLNDNTIFASLPDRVRTELKALVVKVARSGEVSRTHPYAVVIDGAERMVRATVQLSDIRGRSNDILVSFEILHHTRTGRLDLDSEGSDQSSQERLHELQHELALTKESLQTVIEELETSNEELQSLNEEAQAANEELQASNEELQTANEELQATNEELTTVNDELTLKSVELSESNADLTDIEESQGLATMVIARDFTVRRFNRKMTEYLEMPAGRRSFSIGEVTPSFEFPGFHEAIRSAVLEGKQTALDFPHAMSEWRHVSVSPYTMTDALEGEPQTQATVVIRDVTDQKRLSERMADAQKLEAIGLLTGGWPTTSTISSR